MGIIMIDPCRNLISDRGHKLCWDVSLASTDATAMTMMELGW